MEDTIAVVVWVAGVSAGLWLTFGFVAYGMVFAFFQRRYTYREASKDLYRDMKTGLKFIPQGFIGFAKATSYLMAKDGWNEEEGYPTYGLKFLPRHEYRY